jgi:hypothetical protein
MHEQQRDGASLEDFEQGKELLPVPYAVNAYVDLDGNEIADANGSLEAYKFLAYKNTVSRAATSSMPNVIDKIVTVKNTGTEAAYIRTQIAFPAVLDDGAITYDASSNVLHWNGASANDTFGAANFGGDIENDWYWGKSTDVDWPDNGGDWNCYQTKVDGVLYNVYVVTHGVAVEAGQTTAPSLFGVYLDAGVNCDDNGYFIMRGDKRVEVDLSNTEILVVSEAVQASGWDNAFTALDQAFGTPGSYNPFVK